MSLAKFLNRLFRRKPIAGYESDIDKFLAQFNAKHPEKSQSQIAEIKKYERIFWLRDHAERKEEKSKIWTGF